MKKNGTAAQTVGELPEDYGRTSPSYPLGEAVSFLKRVQASIGTGEVAGDLIAQALGHKGRTGAASVKIGTLTHFGLIRTAGRGCYRISELGLKVITPKDDSELAEAFAEAATKPSLYKEVFAAFKGNAMPGLLHNILVRDYGVRSEKADRVASTFRKSMESAGLLRNGVLFDLPATEETDAQKPEEGQKNSNVKPFAKVASPDSAYRGPVIESLRLSDRSYTIPLSGARICVLQIPLSVVKADLERIKSWIDLMKDVLIEKAADSESAASSMSQGQAEPPNGTPDGANA